MAHSQIKMDVLVLVDGNVAEVADELRGRVAAWNWFQVIHFIIVFSINY